MRRGPLRLVLIRSGGYDYADVDLSTAIHLVAGNNVGKTSLIAALQFLYIDSISEMHFSHSPKATREHYFPHVGSLVLFECMTPIGLQVIAFRGLGPVQGFDYERLIYTGAYDRSDFLDGRRVRDWSEVAPRLIGRDLRVPLEPRHVRAALTATGDARGPALGLVPLARSGNYESFRFLFRNLITLSRINQDQLKSLFVDISRPRLRQENVDLRSDYAELFARVERQAAGVAALRRVEPTIRRLVERFERRETLRSNLARTWQNLNQAFAHLQVNAESADAQIRLERENLASEVQALNAQLEGIRQRSADLNANRGKVESDVQHLRELEERTREFIPAFEEALRERLANDRDTLIGRLRDATRADASHVQDEIAKLTAAIDDGQRLLERHADAVATWLRAHSGLQDSDLNDIFRVVSPALLGGVIGSGDDDVKIEWPERLVDALQQIRDHFSSAGFSGAGVRVPRTALPKALPLAAYADIDAIRQRLERDRGRFNELQQTLLDIEQRDELQRQRTECERELEIAHDHLRDWEAWQRKMGDLPVHEARLAHLRNEIQHADEQGTEVRDRCTQAEIHIEELQRKAEAHRNSLQGVLADIRRLQPPSPDWPAEDDANAQPQDVQALLEGYRHNWAEHTDRARQVEQHFGEVERETGSRYVTETEVGTIKVLRDELEALPERVEAVEDLWAALVDGMRSAFKGLLEGLDELRRQVSALNRALGQRRISNLERVELELTIQDDLARRLRAVLEAENAPLFTDSDERSRAARDIAAWMEDRPRIDLVDLFDLRFRVLDRTGQAKTFRSLSQIESHGTSTTIKVLVHLELMRSLLTDEPVSIPFVLDEVATLDDTNLRGLIEHAHAMGFIPVVASPKASDTVDTMYLLRHSAGGLILDETSRLVIHRANDAA